MRILLATDGRSGSTGAVRLAMAIGGRTDVSVSAHCVLMPLEIHGPPSARLLVEPDPDFPDVRKAQAAERVGAWLNGFGEPAAAWPLTVEVGSVAPTIVRRAAAEDATLIVLGLGRHDRTARWLGTETALRVAHLSHVPVLAVPASVTELPRRALVGVDFSDFSRRAVEDAIPLLGEGAEIHLAHAVMFPTPEITGAGDGWRERLREGARAEFDTWIARLAHPPSLRLTPHVLEGDPAEELLRTAERVGADLLVAGSHGMGFVGRFLIGSVSSRLLRGATCSVLISPPTDRPRELHGAAE
jgi:nucleotide-binding universal stress UspA family protein